MSFKQLREERKRLGLCKFCGAPIAKGSTVYCEKHLAKYREYERKYQQRKLEEGRCRSCGKPINSNYQRCPECENRLSMRKRQSYKERKEKGVCVKYGGALAAGSTTLCEEHLMKQREANRKYHVKIRETKKQDKL